MAAATDFKMDGSLPPNLRNADDGTGLDARLRDVQDLLAGGSYGDEDGEADFPPTSSFPPPSSPSSSSKAAGSSVARYVRHVRIQTPTTSAPPAPKESKGKIQGIVHHLTLPPLISAAMPGPVLDTVAWEGGMGKDLDPGLVQYYKGKCDTQIGAYLANGKTLKTSPDDSDLAAAVNACHNFADNAADGKDRGLYYERACRTGKLDACGKIGYGLLLANLQERPEERREGDVEEALRLLREAVGGAEEAYEAAVGKYSGRPSGQQQATQVNFYKYHLGCGRSNRFKSVKDVAGAGPLVAPDGTSLTVNNDCTEWGMIGLGLAHLFGAGVSKNYDLARTLIEIAADDGNTEAMYYVGRLHRGWMGGEGSGAVVNEEAALGAFQVSFAELVEREKKKR